MNGKLNFNFFFLFDFSLMQEFNETEEKKNTYISSSDIGFAVEQPRKAFQVRIIFDSMTSHCYNNYQQKSVIDFKSIVHKTSRIKTGMKISFISFINLLNLILYAAIQMKEKRLQFKVKNSHKNDYGFCYVRQNVNVINVIQNLDYN